MIPGNKIQLILLPGCRMKRILFKPLFVLEAGVSLCSPLFRNVISLYVDQNKCSFKMATAVQENSPQRWAVSSVHHQKFTGLFHFYSVIYITCSDISKIFGGFPNIICKEW